MKSFFTHAHLRMLGLLLCIFYIYLAIYVGERIRYGKYVDLLWPFVTSLTIPAFLSLGVLTFLFLKPIESKDFPEKEYSENKRYFHSVLIFACFIVLFSFSSFYLKEIWLYPINPMRADMLPLMEVGLNSFWNGEGIYKRHQVADWDLGMTFSPALWLSYSIPWLLNLDLRILNFSAIVTGFFSIFLLHISISQFSRCKWLEVGPFIPLITLMLVWFFSPFESFSLISHLTIYWLYLVLFGIFFRLRFPVAASIFLGLAISSRLILVIVLPIIIIHLLRNYDRKHQIRFLVPVTLTGLIIVFPFFITNPSGFLYPYMKGYSDALSWILADSPHLREGFGFTAFLFHYSLEILKWPLILIGQFLLYSLTFFKAKNDESMFLLCGISLLWFLSFMIIPWYYTFASAMILLSFSFPIMDERFSEKLSRKKNKWQVCYTAGIFSLLLLTFLMAFLSEPKNYQTPPQYGDHPILRSRYLMSGTSIQGWQDNTKSTAPTFDGESAMVAIPYHRFFHQHPLELELAIETFDVSDPVTVPLKFNSRNLPELEITESGINKYRIPLDDVRVMKGNNTVRFDFSKLPESSSRPKLIFIKILKTTDTGWIPRS